MSENSFVKEILERFKPIWALNHALGLLDWDLETYMPSGSSSARGSAQARLALTKQEKVIALTPLVAQARKTSGLNDFENGALRMIMRDLDYYTKVPPTLVEELQRTATEATVVWREARRNSDFTLFKPHLDRMIELKKQEAEKLGYDGHPYNALLNRFEEGLTIGDVDRTFSRLIPKLKRILSKVVTAGKFPPNHPLESAEYEEASMKQVNREILNLLGMPEQTFRMDISAHPFTKGLSITDVRITTRYKRTSFKDTLFSVIHECGHAIHRLQMDPSFEYTPLVNTTSLGVNESQSRFWENFVGRSRDFVKLIYPILKRNLGSTASCNEEDIYRYFNAVRPSPIRVEADELTYNFHIILRYELEKRLIGGETSVSEIPSLWNDMMDEYVGIRPANDEEGVLQDIHWSDGEFGYFPTYSLGNVIAGMVFHKIRKDIDLEAVVKSGRLVDVKKWLQQQIHTWGGTYSPKVLQQKVFGEVYNPDWLIDYLEQKFLG